ncbi:MAG: 30S ribosomal protein S20 [candidate division WOR-3 bacterium]|nr:30S ribosomal protein S20 [candidate division WOR-3 bacterium]
MAKRTKSALKSARKSDRKRIANRIKKLRLKKAIKELRATKDPKSFQELYPKVQAIIDKSAKSGIIHKNKASRLKSRLSALLSKITEKK